MFLLGKLLFIGKYLNVFECGLTQFYPQAKLNFPTIEILARFYRITKATLFLFQIACICLWFLVSSLPILHRQWICPWEISRHWIKQQTWPRKLPIFQSLGKAYVLQNINTSVNILYVNSEVYDMRKDVSELIWSKVRH